MRGVVRQVGILQAGMRATMTATIVAAESSAAPRFAAGTEVATMPLSLVGLTILLVWRW